MKKEDLREKTSLFVSLIKHLTDPDYKCDGRSAYRNSDKRLWKAILQRIKKQYYDHIQLAATWSNGAMVDGRVFISEFIFSSLYNWDRIFIKDFKVQE